MTLFWWIVTGYLALFTIAIVLVMARDWERLRKCR